MKNAVSNIMRELAHLLIVLKENYNIDSLVQALKPENYDAVVKASRIISGYDSEKNTYTVCRKSSRTYFVALVRVAPLLGRHWYYVATSLWSV